MAVVKSQVRLNPSSGAPEDVVTNTWYFATASPSGSLLEALAGHLGTFYAALEGYFPESVAGGTGAHEVRFYDAEGSPPQEPLLAVPFDLSPGSGPALPREAAVCLSFRSGPPTGLIPGRRRGRVYLGPWLTAGTLATSTNDARVATGLMEDIMDAYEALIVDVNTDSIVHSVWSATDTLDRTVSDAWVDNAWDIQRRRGTDATTRISREVQ